MLQFPFSLLLFISTVSVSLSWVPSAFVSLGWDGVGQVVNLKDLGGFSSWKPYDTAGIFFNGWIRLWLDLPNRARCSCHLCSSQIRNEITALKILSIQSLTHENNLYFFNNLCLLYSFLMTLIKEFVFFTCLKNS